MNDIILQTSFFIQKHILSLLKLDKCMTISMAITSNVEHCRFSSGMVGELFCGVKVKVKVWFYIALHPVRLNRSKRCTLSSPGRPVHSDTVLGFSWKHSSHAAIAQQLFTHISTTVYSQVGDLLIYTAESTEAS